MKLKVPQYLICILQQADTPFPPNPSSQQHVWSVRLQSEQSKLETCLVTEVGSEMGSL